MSDLIRYGREDLGTHHFAAEDIIAFARRYDPQPFHTDEDAARGTLFGGLCASGWHTTAAWMRCNILNLQAEAEARQATGLPIIEWGPSPGIRNLVWHRPVHAGDTISFWRQVKASRPSRQEGWTMLTMEGGGDNQESRPVLSFSSAVLCRLP